MVEKGKLLVEQVETLMKDYTHICTKLRILRFEAKRASEMATQNNDSENFMNFISPELSKGALLLRESPEYVLKRSKEIARLDYIVSLLNEAIECLQDHHRKTIKAIYVNGLTYDNAGRALHASKSTIKRWRKEAIEIMSELLTV